jgi:hypothetical protein
MTSQHVYEVRLRKDHRGFDLISDALPFGALWYIKAADAINYVKFRSRSHDAVIRVYDRTGNVIPDAQDTRAISKSHKRYMLQAKSRLAVKHNGSFRKLRLLRLVDRFTHYSGQFAVQVYSVQAARTLCRFAAQIASYRDANAEFHELIVTATPTATAIPSPADKRSHTNSNNNSDADQNLTPILPSEPII